MIIGKSRQRYQASPRRQWVYMILLGTVNMVGSSKKGNKGEATITAMTEVSHGRRRQVHLKSTLGEVDMSARLHGS